MFETLPHPKPDAILAQMAPYKVDTRPDKMNLGVGVSRAISERISLRADVRGVTSQKKGGFEP